VSFPLGPIVNVAGSRTFAALVVTVCAAVGLDGVVVGVVVVETAVEVALLAGEA
jgi:hypothetical protein